MKTLVCLVVCGLVSTAAFAQGNLTGTISGHVIDQNGGVLPGTTVTAKSPSLQGSRTVVTTSTGDYIIPFLSPGEYTLTFELKGFETASHKTLVTASSTVTLDVKLQVGAVTNAVTVVGGISDAVVPGITSSTTIKQDRVNNLPLNRGIDATTALAPGVLRTGPSNQNGVPSLSISGGVTTENLVLVNGVVAQDNVRRTSVPVYIEDAIQETTIETSGVSAEFGRFAGGVVNAITRSGGNTFSGTYRLSLNNDNWRSVTPFPGETKANVTVPVNEYTVGGPVFRDRLWFFTAGRFQNETAAQQLFQPVLTPYDRITLRRRFEGKGTYGLRSGQTIKVAYVNNYTRTTNGSFQNELDLQSLTNREDPEHTWSATYNGVLKNNIFVEAQYSQHKSSIVGAGAKATDLIAGTLMVDGLNGGRFNSATFCGVCRPEDRDNQDVAVKATYFMSRAGWGSHTIIGGYDRFADQVAVDNHQSGSDYRIFTTDTIFRNGVIYPILDPTPGSTLIRYNPIANPTQGSNFLTNSLFVNDLWRVNDRMTFNLGLRYDSTGGTNSAGAQEISGGKVSPRLGLTFDPKGDGVWILNASYATYVSAVNNGFANNGSSAGAPARLDFDYLGPAVNLNPNAPTLVSTTDAINTVFTWFLANGGINRPNVGAAVPGVNRKVSADLGPPNTNEVAGGVTRRLGSRGTLRADTVYRKYHDFYSDHVDTTTGQVSNSLGTIFDVIVTENTNKIERQYAGLNLSGSWRPNARTTVQFAYTLSHTWGNAEGENSASGPITATVDSYPEYRDPRWNNPIGDLQTDQRHKARIVATYDMPLSRFGSLTVGAIEYLGSGNPYSAIGSVASSRFVPAGLGYKNAPSTVNYYFTERDAFRSENWYSTDLAATYSYRAHGLSKMEGFVKFELLNTFNQSSIINTQYLNTAVLTNSSTPAKYALFNPFTDTPVKGTNWDLGPTFGQATSRFAYQTPRTFRMSFGVRF
jgi:Carboxypeptidase regulatory-like domain